MFDNDTLLLTSTIKPIRQYYLENPFDSWYIGGILFMCTVMLVLLYANYYRDNYCQILWMRLLTKLGITRPIPPSSNSLSLHRALDPLII